MGVGGKTDEEKGRQNRELRGDGGGGDPYFKQRMQTAKHHGHTDPSGADNINSSITYQA